MPPLARLFSEHLRHVVVPALQNVGFVFDGSRTFRRLIAGTPYVQIINFQLGERFMEGKFTVNLAVYSPDDAAVQVEAERVFEYHCATRRRQRLGLLIPSRLGALVRLPVLGLFFPRDKWWQAGNPRNLQKASDAIFAYGLAWLETNTPGRAIAPTR
jgi:hypothetical protein